MCSISKVICSKSYTVLEQVASLDVSGHALRKQGMPLAYQTGELPKEYTMSITPDFVAMLACPACRGPLTLNENEAGLVCPACSVIYPVRDGIPVMLVEEARQCNTTVYSKGVPNEG